MGKLLKGLKAEDVKVCLYAALEQFFGGLPQDEFLSDAEREAGRELLARLREEF